MTSFEELLNKALQTPFSDISPEETPWDVTLKNVADCHFLVTALEPVETSLARGFIVTCHVIHPDSTVDENARVLMSGQAIVKRLSPVYEQQEMGAPLYPLVFRAEKVRSQTSQYYYWNLVDANSVDLNWFTEAKKK